MSEILYTVPHEEEDDFGAETFDSNTGEVIEPKQE
jgi:hypothetical protein